MIRIPRKSIKVLVPDQVKVVNGVLYIGSEPPIILNSDTTNNGYKVSQCNLACAETGTPEEVEVCITIPDSCECPYVWWMEIHKLPVLTQYDTNNTFREKKLYEFGNADGSTPTAAQVGQGIVELINADPSSPVTAAYDATLCGEGSDPGIVLTGKTNGHTFEVFVGSGTTTITTPGVSDGLTEEKLYRMFPLEHGKFAEIPPKTFCGNYCILTAHLKECCSNASDAGDTAMDGGVQGVSYDILWAIPRSILNPTSADEVSMLQKLDDYFTCLQSAEGASPEPLDTPFVLSAVAWDENEGNAALDDFEFTFTAIPTDLQGDAATWQYWDTVTGAWVTGNGGFNLPNASSGSVTLTGSTENLAAGTYFIRVETGTPNQFSTIASVVVS